MFVLRESSRDIWLLVLVILISIAANLPDKWAGPYTIDKKYLLIALTLVVAVSLIRYVRLTLILATVVLVVGANLPSDLAQKFGIHQLALVVTLLVMVAVAVAYKVLRLPTGLETNRTANTVYGAKALFGSVLKGNVSSVGQLIASGVNVNIRTATGKTPLMAASYKGYGDVVQMLLEAGANVDVTDAKGNTALNIAQRMGHSRVVTLLTMAGAKQ